ncbi:MAG: restriction endonuclease [Xanthobacteraceae bacterium]|nr:restriction endonuclease [Xanthobacteraceae bacterium]QYK45625.1 MAG: restriction endonuclease [Xanthobacteraceae bacterium]
MSKQQTHKDWEIYERMVARLIADQAGTDMCVTPNARIRGQLSGRSRQIDVLIEARHDTDNSRRLIVDAKRRTRKIDVKDVEELLGLMQDVKATHGYLVSATGHTKAAEKRAQMSVSIRIVPVDRLENFDPSTWPCCKNHQCANGRIFWDGYPELTLRGVPLEKSDQAVKTVSFVHYVGKCDRCGMFHVWCTTCDDTLITSHDDENDVGHQCRCKMPWFWLASVEEDDDGQSSAELHAVLGTGKVITASRRSL